MPWTRIPVFGIMEGTSAGRDLNLIRLLKILFAGVIVRDLRRKRIEEDRFTTVICQSELESTLRAGARRLLLSALDAEIENYLQMHPARDRAGHRLVVRNGHGVSRELQTGLGAIEVQMPRIDDRRKGGRFISRILPPYVRRVPSLENLIPVLYLGQTPALVPCQRRSPFEITGVRQTGESRTPG